MEEEKISVIVPAYNLEKYIARAIESISSQSYQNLEIILVDDGSTDKTLQVMKEQQEKDERIKVIHKENGGVTRARMVGVEASTGTWIGFVDGDDWIEPAMYEILMKNAKQYDADISHCGYQMIFVDGRIHYFYNTGLLAEQDKLTGLKDLLAGSRIEPGLWNKLFRKTLFHSLLHDGKMDYTIKTNEDLLMNFYLFKEAEKSVFYDVCPYHYIKRQGSASGGKRTKRNLYDGIRVKEQILRDSPDALLPAAKRAYLGTVITKYSGLVFDKQPEFKEDCVKIRQMVKNGYADKKIMSAKMRLQAWMIIHIPWLYRPLWRFYVKHLQKSLYA